MGLGLTHLLVLDHGNSKAVGSLIPYMSAMKYNVIERTTACRHFCSQECSHSASVFTGTVHRELIQSRLQHIPMLPSPLALTQWLHCRAEWLQTGKVYLKYIGIGSIAVGAVSVGGALAIPLLGFKSAGIAAGSVAATVQSAGAKCAWVGGVKYGIPFLCTGVAALIAGRQRDSTKNQLEAALMNEYASICDGVDSLRP